MARDDEKDALPEHLQTLLSGSEDLVKEKLSKTQKRIATGRLGRAFRLSKLAASSGGRMIAQKARSSLTQKAKDAAAIVTQKAIAAEMLEVFGEMRGVTMKLGQMLSYLDGLLPPEAQKVLAILQRDAPAIEYSEVRQQFINEIGKSPEECFAEFDTVPIAAASIGQVHRARLKDGQEVAVKIQYPGIADAMKADLKNAKVMSLFQRLFFFRTNVSAIMKEIEERLLDECDYRKEASYQRAFRKRYQGHPFIVVPEVHLDYSSEKVLTTSFYRGLTFYQWLETSPSQAERNRVANVFYRFYMGSFYMDGLFNCDPHPGNYLFSEGGKIVFFDYGCVRPFPSERRKLWIEMCRAIHEDNEERICSVAKDIGFVLEGVDFDYAAFRELMRYLYQGYLVDDNFDFKNFQPMTTFKEMFTENPNVFKLDMPPDAVFLNRITFGMISLVADMDGRVNCYQSSRAYFHGDDPHWPEDPYRGKLESAPVDSF